MLSLLKTNVVGGDRSFAVPSLAEVSPEYAALIEQQDTLTKRLAAAIAELRQIAKSGEATADPPPTPAEVARQHRIDALLKGGQYDLAAPVPQFEPPPSSRYWALKREIEDIGDFALPEVETKLREAVALASAIIREKFKDAHRKMVREMAAGLRDVHAVNVQYWAFSDAMSKAGVAWGALGVAFFRNIGHPEDRNSPLGIWFKEAKNEGHIGASEIPESLR
jgi:hypothetical protein